LVTFGCIGDVHWAERKNGLWLGSLNVKVNMCNIGWLLLCCVLTYYWRINVVI